MSAHPKGMSPRARSFAVAGIAAAAVAVVAGGLFFGIGAMSVQSEANRVYAQHHPVGETNEKRAAAEAKMKQAAAEAEKRREEANAATGQAPDAVYTPPPQPQVAANRAMPAGTADPASPARSTTGLFADAFAKDLLMARAMVSGSTAQPVAATLVPDSCMESWVREHLHDYDGKSSFGVTTVCGRPVALIAGAARHVTVLNFGRRIADGETAEVLRQPDVAAAYLGVAE